MTEHDFDILQCGKAHESTFPILARFARDILAVPVSYSHILDERWMSLKPDMVEMITLTKDWDQAAQWLQENIASTAEIAKYFDNLYVNDPPLES